ncbi:TPA: hypothetical protein EYN09_09705 [Candidatus Poribacteria bacterium]|nr:hypothetical protein [Candidatus Poribacteria bacterium]
MATHDSHGMGQWYYLIDLLTNQSFTQHGHADIYPSCYGQVGNGNQNWHLVVINEMPILVHCVLIGESSQLMALL